MSGWRGAAIAAITLYFAVAADQALSRWTILGGRPDYLVLSMSVLSLYATRRGGAAVGFAAGWLYACVDGANMWQYVAIRTLGGFGIAWMIATGIERSLLTATLAVIGGTLFCRIGLMFLAPPGQIALFLGDTIKTAAYNGVLAMLLYATLNRILGPRR